MVENIAVIVENFSKSYGSVKAVDDISFSVKKGEIFGMVGPNGAGKTTTMECIVGLRDFNAGSISVLGCNPAENSVSLRNLIGVQLQESQIPERIKVSEALELFSSLYENTIDYTVLLKSLNLEDKTDSLFSSLSGGQKRRFFVALALVGNPEILFLDELTTGLDPQARLAMWQLIKDVSSAGKTVFLTTHYMDEAEKLCDRVAIIDHGKIVALDTPENLINSLDTGTRVIFEVESEFDEARLNKINGISNIKRENNMITIQGKSSRIVVDVVLTLHSAGTGLNNLRTERVTLEDVFLAHTGHHMRD